MHEIPCYKGSSEKQCTLFTKWPNVLQWLKQYSGGETALIKHHENKAAYILMSCS